MSDLTSVKSPTASRWACLVAILSYGYLCLLWFDTGLEQHLASLPSVLLSPILPVVALVLSLGYLLVRSGLPRPFGEPVDNRIALLLFVLTCVVRVPLLSAAYGLFSSDSAIHGLMALHILEGRHHPVLSYTESYDGSLKAHLTALLAGASGEPVVSFAAASVILYGVFVVALYVLARTILTRRSSVLAASLVVISPGFLTAWSVKNDGSYVEVLAFGTVLLALGARALEQTDGRPRRAFWMGAMGGLAFWSHILATYYLMAGVIALVGADWTRRLLLRMGLFLSGFLLGQLPLVLWNSTHAGLSYRWWTRDETGGIERIGRTIDQLGATVSESLPRLAGWWPMEVPSGSLAVLPIVLGLFFPAAALVFALDRRRKLRELLAGRLRPEAWLLLFAVLVVAVFAQSTYGWLTHEPRYLIFLFSVSPIFLATTLGRIGRQSMGAGVVVAALLFGTHLFGSSLYATQALAGHRANRRFLREIDRLGVRYAYTDFYVSYKYMFLSHGKLVMSSELGPEQTERYPRIREEIAEADRVALIPRSFRMARRICKKLNGLGVSYRREDLLFPVIYDLDPPIELTEVR